jgi:hypothetical protein
MYLHEDEIKAAGLEPQAVAALARRLERAAKDARKMGLTVFGGTGTGTLRFNDDQWNPTNRPLILADIEGPWDGGDGASWTDDAGLLRGE